MVTASSPAHPSSRSSSARSRDVIVLGAGHNGLVAALLLARAGLDVLVVEARAVLGGAVRTERPFAAAPNLSTSTGAYLLGLMPPELAALLGISLPTLRRDPHYFLPTTGDRYLAFGSDRGALERQFRTFFSERDWSAHVALEREIALLREDVAPSWLEPPLSLEETAARFVRPALRETFVDLCRGSVGEYLARFGFESELVQAMYAVTDGFSGLFGGWDSPGTGLNFLVHNMCRLPGSDGTWLVLRGGMGTLTAALAAEFTKIGGEIAPSSPARRVLLEGGAVRGVELEDGTELRARVVVANCDPFTLRDLVGAQEFSDAFNARLDAQARPGSTFKLNLALARPPKFTCLPAPPPGFGPTVHLLPEEGGAIAALRVAFEDARQGRLPEFPAIEWYVHTTVDGSLTDEHGRQSSALFVQWVPYEIAGSSWDAQIDRYSDHLLSICDRFAPGTSASVVDRMPLSPPAIERYFGIRHGHIHHIDNSFGFAERFPHALPIPGLYSCSAGTHPAGSVIGCAGYLAARRALADLELPEPRASG